MEDIPCQISKPHMTIQLLYLVNTIPPKDLPPIEGSLPLLLSFSFKEEADLTRKYSKLLEADYLMGFHTGSGSPIKNWPVEHFATLADLLAERKNVTIVLFGGKGDRNLASQFLKR